MNPLKFLPLLAGLAVSAHGQTASPAIEITPQKTNAYRIEQTFDFQKWEPARNENRVFLPADNPKSFFRVVGLTNFPPLSPWRRPSSLVEVSPFNETGTETFGPTVGQTNFEYMTFGQEFRVRQSGVVRAVGLKLISDSNVESVSIRFWRRTLDHWRLVGDSGNILSSLTVGEWRTVPVVIPGVMAGDFVGVRVRYSKAVERVFESTEGVHGVTTLMVFDGGTGTGFDWGAASKAVGVASPPKVYMDAPTMVAIGDSIVAGHPGNFSFAETQDVTDVEASFPDRVAKAFGWPYQNVAIGGQSSSQIADRFASDVLPLKPQFVLIDGGINDDLRQTGVEEFRLAWSYILEQCNENQITPIVLLIPPWTGGTDTQLAERDDRNQILASFVSGYGGILVDCSRYVGINRPSGPAGNLWDIKPEFMAQDGYGAHYNLTGYAWISQAVMEEIGVRVK